MKKIWLGAWALAALSMWATTGLADDSVGKTSDHKTWHHSAEPSVWSWSGFYVGANFGGGWNQDNGNHFCIDPGGILNGPTCQELPAGMTGSINASGAIGGGQLGYNWQARRVVIGIEADIQASDIAGSTTVSGPFPFAGIPSLALPAGVFAASEKIAGFGTVRARVGYAGWDRALIYATGGLAYGDVAANSVFTAPNVGLTFSGSSSTTKVGWTLGGGLEFALTDTVSAKFEGLYYDLGRLSSVAPGAPVPDGYQHNKEFDLGGEILRVGINYKLGDR